MGRAPDSPIEWVGARDVSKLNVNPQPHSPHEFLFPVAAHCPPPASQGWSRRLASTAPRGSGDWGATLKPAVRVGTSRFLMTGVAQGGGGVGREVAGGWHSSYRPCRSQAGLGANPEKGSQGLWRVPMDN